MLDALDTNQVTAFKHYVRTFATVAKLMDSAAERTGFTPVPGAAYQDDGYSVWVHFEMPSGSNWLYRFEPLERVVELCLSDRDYWSRDQHPEPCFGAGFTVEEAVYEQLAVRKKWVDLLEDAGYCFYPWEGTLVLYRTKRLADLVDEGATLPAQAAALGRWARKAFIDLGRKKHDPGAVTIPVEDE